MSSPKILVADDSPLVLRMIEKMLADAGFGVVTAQDGIEAVEKSVSEDVSLVILDVTMPRMNGYQACRLLKTEPATRDLPVIILTSRDQAGDRFWGLETGADYYVTKDSEPRRILDLVRNVLADESAPRRPRPPAGARTSVDILSRVNELLDRKLYEATILSEIGRVARSLVQFDETFTSVMSLVARVVDFTIGAMAFVDDDELEVLIFLHRRADAALVEEAKARLMEAVGRARGGAAFRQVRARLFTPAGQAPYGSEETSLQGFIALPVVTGERLSGLLAMGGKAVARLHPDTEAFLKQVANQAYIVTENSRLFDRVKNLSIRDSLTGLYNHRHSMELLAQEFERVARYEGSVSLLMIDIDHFKQINDASGHQAGDQVLREVARTLREGLRTVDALGRYGGEEFVAVLPHTPSVEALATAERLRRAVAEADLSSGGKPIRATISVGVASCPAPGMDAPGDLVRAADKALYAAKQAGRNRVVGPRQA